MKLSIVTTLFYSEEYIHEFFVRICEAAKDITDDYEIIFVNDGSPDKSIEIALELYNEHDFVKVVDLSRNFGHHKAAMTGLKYANGDLVFLIDVDLEEEPELLVQFFDVYSKSNVDVVYGKQIKRKGGFLNRFFGLLYWKIYNFLSSYEIPENLTMARLMSRRYVNSLLLHRERMPDISGLWQITGFLQKAVDVYETSRGKTTYTLKKKLALLINSITGFSNRPLVYIAALGTIILLLSTFYGSYILLVALLFGRPPDGFLSIILSLWFLGGLILFCLGIISIYLSVIFIEVKARPYTIIREYYGGDNHDHSRRAG